MILDVNPKRVPAKGTLGDLLYADRSTSVTEQDWAGLVTYSETAARLDQPIGTVKTRIRSALATLRKTLGREGNSR